MGGYGNKLVRLMTPADRGTTTGREGQVFPMADDRSIEVPEDHVATLLGYGYTIYEPPGTSAPEQLAELQSKIDDVSSRLEAVESPGSPAAGAVPSSGV